MLGSILTALGVTGSCSSVDGTEVDDGAITADITVSSAGGSVSFTVGLKKGRHDVDLTGDARVTGEDPDRFTVLEKSKFLGQVAYRGMLYAESGDYSPGETMTVRLERSGKPTDGDPVSTVALPENLTLTGPREGESLSRGEAFTIVVDDAPGSYDVSFSGSCLDPTQPGLSFAEGQPLVVPAGHLVLGQGQDPAAHCPVQVSVSRVLAGELSPAFEGGVIRSRTGAFVTIGSVP